MEHGWSPEALQGWEGVEKRQSQQGERGRREPRALDLKERSPHFVSAMEAMSREHRAATGP